VSDSRHRKRSAGADPSVVSSGLAPSSSIFSETVPLCPLCTAVTKADAISNGQPAGKKRKLANGACAGSRGYGGNGRDDDEEDEEEHYVNPWKDKPILKPDITFFGQALDDSFDRCLLADREEVDLLVVVGTSLQVRCTRRSSHSAFAS
jgi:NAD-dependent histone deacetylase SIR2